MTKFSNNIQLKTTNLNFEKCLDVIEHFFVLNKIIVDQNLKKLIFIKNEAERDFPYELKEIQYLELDEKKTNA